MVEAGIPRGLVPNHPGQFSAYGFVVTDARVDRHRTLQMSSQRFDPTRADSGFRRAVGPGSARTWLRRVTARGSA